MRQKRKEKKRKAKKEKKRREHKRKEKPRKEKKVKEKKRKNERKQKKRKEAEKKNYYTFWHQFDGKPSIIPACPDHHMALLCICFGCHDFVKSCARVPYHSHTLTRLSRQGGVYCITCGTRATVSNNGHEKANAVLDICDFVKCWRLSDCVVYYTHQLFVCTYCPMTDLMHCLTPLCRGL